MEAYLDPTGAPWCVWADPLFAGHVYFARAGAVPEYVTAINPFCGGAEEPRPQPDPYPIPVPDTRTVPVRSTTEEPYRQEGHLDFGGLGRTRVTALGLKENMTYLLYYAAESGAAQPLYLGSAVTDNSGQLNTLLSPPPWTEHEGAGELRVVPLYSDDGAGEPFPVGSSWVTADC